MDPSVFRISFKPVVNYFISCGDALSQLVNAVVFFSGNANQSLSARCYEQRDHWFFGRLKVVVDKIFLFFGDDNHCESSYRRELALCHRRIRSQRET